MCRLRCSFFGLNDEYTEYMYEQFFFMKYYGGWSFTEPHNLPVKIRNWFLKKLIEQKDMEQKANTEGEKS